MHFSVVKEDILKYLQYANSFTNPKGLNDILQNIYIQAEDNYINIRATNYQIGFSCNFEVKSIEKEGRVTVSCRKLLDIIKELPDNSLIEIIYDDVRLNIISGKSKFKLSTIPTENFPSMGEIIPEHTLKIPSSDLINILKRVVFCVSSDVQKIEYTGVHFKVNRDRLEVFAAGMQRVGISSTILSTEYSDDFLINIPRKTVTELIRVFEGKGLMEIEIDSRQVSFTADNIKVYTKLIDRYVKNVDRLFRSEDYPIKARINTKLFLDVSKRISAITSEDTPGINLSFDNLSLTISSLENIYGEGKEVIDIAEYNHEPFDIILNFKHLNEILSAIETEEFILEIKDRRLPALVTPYNIKENINYRYLVVPISIDRL